MSGPRAFELLAGLTEVPPIERATVVAVRLDLELGAPTAATLLAFPSPRSSTGEDVAELHLPGSPFLVRRLLDRLVSLGARPAQPGEFTARAFFNGKLGLASAEGVAATIGSANRAELDAARSLLAGELAKRLTPLLDDLVALLAAVETDVDFVDEDVSVLSDAATRARIDAITLPLRRLVETAPRLERLAHEPRVVLVGRPNAGKSTLLNRLAGQSRAVVSSTAGTTRDALSASVALPSGTITLVDVAGIEEMNASDPIEQAMATTARNEVARADRVVYVREATDQRPPMTVGRAADLRVVSKADLVASNGVNPAIIQVSALSGDGIDRLRIALDAIAFPTTTQNGADALALNARHVREIEQALLALDEARGAIGQGVELIASSLRQAVDALGRVLGRVSPDDVLGRIFSSFCIGK